MTLSPQSVPEGRIRAPDLYLGVVSIVLGAGVLIYALNLPTLGDGMPGPGLFPGMVAVGFMLLGTCLIVQALTQARKRYARASSDGITAGANGGTQPAVSGIAIEEESLSSKRVWANGIVVLAAIIGYIALAEHLGFIITMFLVSLVIMFVLKANLVSAVVTSLILSFTMWAVFERGLRVQLPDGLLW